jgi:hypothetical protein
VSSCCLTPKVHATVRRNNVAFNHPRTIWSNLQLQEGLQQLMGNTAKLGQSLLIRVSEASLYACTVMHATPDSNHGT